MQRYAVCNYACMLIYVYQESDERHPARRQNMPNMSFTKYSYYIYHVHYQQTKMALLSHSVVIGNY
jgi:hypothetical protein